MDTQTLQQDLVELVVLLQGLNPQHLATVAQFLRHRPEDLLLGQLGELLRSATSSQVDRLVSLATSTNAQPPPGVPNGNQPKAEQGNDGDNEQEDSEQDMEAIDKLPKEMVTSFGLLVQIYQLYQLLNRLSILQLMKIFEFVPSGPQVQQLQLLQQLQQLLGQLLPETLASLHQELASAEAGREQTVLSQLLQLRKEHFHLYQPLRMLLQLDLDDLLALQDALPRLQPVQMLQLLALLQLQPFDVLELKRILHAARLGPSAGHQDPALLDDFGGLLPPPTSASPAVSIPPTPTATTATASVTTPGGLPGLPQGQVPLAVPLPRPTPAPPVPHAPRARPLLRIVEQPPEKSVYKRNLKPNPTLQLVEEELGMESNLYIAPVLIRCDTLEEKNKLLTGNKPVKVAPGRVVSFRRLKIMATSHQQGESLFAIRFELRRYHGNEYEILDYVQSNPVCVLSHSTQLRPVSSMTPSVTEVIPYSGSTAGGTRVAVLGTNFVDSPSARVRFDNIDVMPIFHGPRTLICTTPPHHSGIVSVRVSNDSKLWSPTAASFTYEEKGSGVAQTNAASVRPAFEFEGLGAGDVAQAAWQGNADMLRDSLDGASGDEGLDAPDARGYTALHIAAAGGDGHVVELLLQHGADADKRDSRGNAALHWAAGFGHAEIVESLLDSGADANATNLGLETPLHWAAATGHAEICELLLLGGAHCFASAIHGDTPLHRAAAVDETAAVLTLLQYGAPTNVQDDDGDTPLHYALREGSNAAFAVLLEHGADPTLPNCDFESPLHFAAAFAGVDLVRGLLNAGADVGAADVTKATAVHWAAELGSGDVLEALLEAGAQAGLKDTFGHTPLVYASDCGVEAAIAPLLCSAACDMDALLSQYLDLDTASFVADDGDEEGEADDDGFGLAAMGPDAAAIELLTLGLDAVSLLGEHEQAALQKQDRAALRSIGDSCHGRASLASQLAAAATGGGATGAAFRVGAATPRALPDGLMQLASSPASSFAAFAPASVLSESPAGSRGFFPALGFSSFGHAAAAF